jgi:hypothetical protein
MTAALKGVAPVGLPGLGRGRGPGEVPVAASPEAPRPEIAAAAPRSRSAESGWSAPSPEDRGFLARLFGRN